MGELARTLGLGGDPNQTAQPIPGSVNDPANVMLGGSPSVGGMSTAPKNQTQSPDIDIVGFKPHKRTTLGFLADALLSGIAHTRVTPFADKANRENMQAVMEGFTSDPLGTIQKMGRLEGHEGDALKLYEQYIDDKRQQGTLDRQNRALDMRNDDYVYNLTANMMGAANEKNWPKMRELAIKRAQARGMDPNEISSVIPEAFDPDSIEFMRYGAVKTKDQMAQQEAEAHHIATETETTNHHKATEAQQATNETGRNNRQNIRENAINARQDKSLRAHPGKGAAATTMTKYGPGLISPDGNKMVVSHQGKRFGYLKVNDKWVPVGEVKGK
jgi:hypothetical protein